MPEESIRFDIEMDARAAIQQIRELMSNAETMSQKIVTFSNYLDAMAKKLNVPWQTLLATFRQINAEASRQHGQTLFGNVGGINQNTIFNNVEAYKNSRDAANNAAAATAAYNKEVDETESSSKRAARGIDAMRIALGAVVAMIVFRAIESIQNFFKSAIQGASDLEMGLYRLAKVERALSKEGIEISPAGLSKGLKELKEQFSFLSEVDITQLLGSVSLLTKSLKLSEDQIIDLSKAIMILNINSTETETVLQTTNKVITALITGKSSGVSGLGVTLSDATLQAKALELGILKVGESVSKLSAQQKAQVKLAVIFDTAGLQDAAQVAQDLAKYEETLEGRTNKVKGAWEDFTAALGTEFAPVIKEVLFGTLKFIEGIHAALVKIKPVLDSMLAFTLVSIREFRATIEGIVSGDITSPFKYFASFLNGEFKNSMIGLLEEMNSVGDAVDTPTTKINTLAENMIKLQEAMQTVNFDDLLNDLEDFQKRAEQMEADFNTKMERMQDDYLRDKERAEQDYEIDRQRIIEDFAQKRRDAEQKYRDKEKDAEARFQEEMRQLREKFLFDLEDALRERDARQVLRLVRQYQMDKQARTNEEALRRQENIRNHQEEMERLRQEEADRLAQLAEEFKIKQQRAEEDYNLKVARENEEHKTDMERLAAQWDERLKTFSEKLAEELGLREGGADAIYQALQKYYGSNGYFDQLYDYSAKSMAERANQMLGMLQQIMNQYAAIASAASNMPIPVPNLGSAPRLTGGIGSAPRTFTATRPTALATGMRGGGREAMGGNIGIEVILSPDLEARVVENSVSAVADVVTRVRRTK